MPRSYRVESSGVSICCRLFTASTRADNGVEPLVSSCSRNEAFCSVSHHHGVLSPRREEKNNGLSSFYSSYAFVNIAEEPEGTLVDNHASINRSMLHSSYQALFSKFRTDSEHYLERASENEHLTRCRLEII